MHRKGFISPDRFQTPLAELSEDEDKEEEARIEESDSEDKTTTLLDKVKRLELENKELKKIIARNQAATPPSPPQTQATSTPPPRPSTPQTQHQTPIFSRLQQQTPIISPRPLHYDGVGTSTIENLERQSRVKENSRQIE
jgi:hypothetical protein